MYKMKNLILVVLGLFVLFGCKQTPKEGQDASQNADKIYSEEELYRPNFHFTPKKGWMNDPNGMFYLNGYYHLYFQYYPDGNVWGPMHWGHAISTDMITWREQPIALYPDEKGYIFSGSAVVDVNNSSGFGSVENPPIIAIFTYHDPEIAKKEGIDVESQAIAYSLDQGRTFTKYANNPVIKNPGIRDFRDPKVTWDAIHQQWILVLAAQDKAFFYASKNLKDWKLLSDFGTNIGAHGGVWECPDFFPMFVDGTEEVKWVLIQSLNPGGYNNGSGTQYFVGDFDGKTFKLDPAFQNDLKEETAFWIDFGKDNYAGVTWSNIPETDGRKLFMGWMSNWEYAQEVPTQKWRSAMTVARELKLVKTNNQYRIYSLPVKEISNYIAKTINKDLLSIEKEVILTTNELVNFESLDVSFKVKNLKEDIYSFSFQNSKGETIKFGINNKEKHFFIDRSKSRDLSFSEKFAAKLSTAPFKTKNNEIDVRLLLDKTSIEIFFNKGETVMTEIFFMQKPIESFSVKSENSKFEIENLIINELNFN